MRVRCARGIPPRRKGWSSNFALNHLAGFLLTHRLLPALRLGGGRMMLTSSASHKYCRVHFDDIMYRRRRYSALGAYKQSKLCNVMFAAAFNRRYAAEGPARLCGGPGPCGHRYWLSNRRAGWSSWCGRCAKRRVCQRSAPARTFAALCAGEARARGPCTGTTAR